MEHCGSNLVNYILLVKYTRLPLKWKQYYVLISRKVVKDYKLSDYNNITLQF